jgi:hypothetical protein
MHRLPKKSSLALITLLIASFLFAFVSPVMGSTGNILINTTTAPSPIVTIQLGGSLNLYFGGVTWSGGQINLYLSADGYASLSDEDTAYGPTFNVAQLTNASVATVDGYSIGYNWINGTVPTTLNVPGGNYYVKAFDGSTAAVAVTDNYFVIEATFEVVPTWGPGQAAIELKGYGLPANELANFSYRCVSEGIGWTTIQDLVLANEYGAVVYATIAPDLFLALGSGEQNNASSTMEFRMIVNGTGQTETANFEQYWRGLIQVKGRTEAMAGTNNLFGNMTDFSTGINQVNVTVLGDVIIAGNFFHPGELTILWDGTTTLGTATANGTGFFNTTVSVPITSKGAHNITIDDGKTVFIFMVNVIPTLILNPTSGPVGTTVTATGYGFPESDGVKINVTIWWDYTCDCYECYEADINITVVQTNVNGHFVTTFVVPSTVGGVHTVYATSDGEYTYADAEFTVTPTLVLSALSISNDGQLLRINGTGLEASYYMDGWYDLCIDYEKDFDIWADCHGNFYFDIIITAGMEPGIHVISLYKMEWGEVGFSQALEDYVLFTVTSEEQDLLLEKLEDVEDLLDDLDDFLRSDSTALHNHLTTIQNDISAAKDAIMASVDGMSSQLTSIESYAKDAAEKASSASTSATSAATEATSAKTAAQQAQSGTSGISTAIYAAIVLSLIAALASIIAVITLQRKVA